MKTSNLTKDSEMSRNQILICEQAWRTRKSRYFWISQHSWYIFVFNDCWCVEMRWNSFTIWWFHEFVYIVIDCKWECNENWCFWIFTTDVSIGKKLLDKKKRIFFYRKCTIIKLTKIITTKKIKKKQSKSTRIYQID